MRTIAITNQKGGCGKTTTAVNLAAAFAEKGNRALLMDLDPQGHSTIGCGYDPDEQSVTVYDALINDQVGIPDVAMPTKFEPLDLAPGNVLLSGAQLDLTDPIVLREKLKMVSDRYEVCVIDCPPSLGPLTLSGLLASTSVVVPVQVHYYAMEGLKQLFRTAQAIQGHFDPRYVRALNVLLTFVESNTLLSRDVQQQMRQFFGDLVFDTVIHKSVRLAEAPGAGEPVLAFAPESRSAAEYRALAQEITDRWAMFEQIRLLAGEIVGAAASAEPTVSHEAPVG